MKLLCLNQVVPQMERAPHKIYMLEFDHFKGELCQFLLFPVDYLHQLAEFKDVTDKTTLNIIGVEGDKQGRDHSKIKTTHALVADLRPLGIYFLFWAKVETPEGFQNALKNGLLSRLMKKQQQRRGKSKKSRARRAS